MDTNVVLAYVQSKSEDSPNREIIQRWERGEFDVLWSRDVLNEYIDKMKEFGIIEARSVFEGITEILE